MTQTVIEAGCDYITATCRTGKSLRKFVSLADKFLHREHAKGNDITRFVSQGYEGYKAGSVQAGRRDDGWLLRLSSAAAHAGWREIYPLASNVSRFDLQTTVRLVEDVEEYLARNHKRARRKYGKSGRAAEVEFRQNTSNSSTLYIGKRVSDRYLRMYNKAGESKLEHYDGCVRLEAEYKNQLAPAAAAELFHSSAPDQAAVSRLSAEFQKAGCEPVSFDDLPEHLCSPRSRSNNDRRLRFLADCCRGSVEKLIAHGKLLEVISALGLAEHVMIIPQIPRPEPTTESEDN